MAVDLRGVTTVLLPGTGSDDDYVYRAFSAALHEDNRYFASGDDLLLLRFRR